MDAAPLRSRYTGRTMRLWTKMSARSAPFSCDSWSPLKPNSTREAIAEGAYAHDTYRASLAADFETAVDTLLSYQIYPPHRMRAHVCTANGRVSLGATIVQRISLSLAVFETAVRVVEFERDADRACFTYATLPGHVELGLASFTVRATENGVTLEIETWSRPGNWLAMVGRPLTRFLQRQSTEEAIAWFRASVA
jgi:uncharacterized protein (UPF0548 family)